MNVLREAADSARLATYFTGVEIKHLTGKGLSSLLFPLPPLAEQHRIVAKVDELMALCDQLETQLTTTQADSRHLLETMLHRALGERNEVRINTRAAFGNPGESGRSGPTQA